MHLTLFLRHSTPGRHSIEKVFRILTPYFSEKTTFQIRTLPLPLTKGLFLPLHILWAWYHRSFINHITGDAHYLAIGLPGHRTVLTIHDLDFLHTSHGIRHFLYKWLWLIIPARKVACITVISEHTRQCLLEYVPEVEEKITLIPNPLRFTPPGKPPTFCLEKPRILQIGTKPNKNLNRLIKALQGLSCELLIIGDLTKALHTLLHKKNITFRHSFNPNDNQLVDWYQLCDIVVLVSTSEGFGLPIIEAQAFGKPLVTSNLSPLRDVAGGGALLVNPYNPQSIQDGIKKICQNEGLRKKLIETGYTNIHRFKPEIIATTYLQLFEKLAQKIQVK